MVFAGFCLVAAISSTAFIKTISDKVLREAREAKKAAEDAKKTATGVESDAREAKQAAEDANKRASGLESAVEPIIAKETDLASDEQPTSLAMQTLPSLSENEEKVLRELCVGKALRTRTSVARKAKMLKPEVDKLVDSLKERGLVDYKMIPKADGGEMRRWFVTPAGRELVARLSPDTEVQG